MPNYIDRNDQQTTLVAVSFDDYVQPGSFEHTLHHLIHNKIDLSAFEIVYKNDARGRPAYHPATLLTVILYAYHSGITSSRKIAKLCEHHVIFMVLSGHTQPHWTTIAHFVSAYPEAIREVFEQVLLVCDEQGLLGHEMIAIDGCKMPSDASREWSGTLTELSRKRDKIRQRIEAQLKAHQNDDDDEDDGSGRASKTLDKLNAAADKIDAFLKDAEPRMGQGKKPGEVKSNITDNDSAMMTTSKGTFQGYTGIAAVDKKHQVIVEAEAVGHGQEQHRLQPVLNAIQTTFNRLGLNEDILHSGIAITADTGYASEANNAYLYDNHINAIVPDNAFRSRDPRFKDKTIHHPRCRARAVLRRFKNTDFQFDPVQLICVCPAGKTLTFAGQRKGPDDKPRAYFTGRLNQCRHCGLKDRCLKTPTSADTRIGHGRQVSFNISKSPHTDWMKQRIDSAEGKRLYAERMAAVEPVFGNIGGNKRLNRFSLRRLAKVNGQWLLYCLVHNIEKLMGYGQLNRVGG